MLTLNTVSSSNSSSCGHTKSTNMAIRKEIAATQNGAGDGDGGVKEIAGSWKW